MRHKIQGFTLIELMIVVAIVGILAAIALPAYSNYITRGKIPEAISGLAAKRVQMEQFYLDNKTYTGGTACDSDTTTSKYFTFSCGGTGGVAASAAGYTLHAQGTGSMAGFDYYVDQGNTKSSAIAAPAKSTWIATSASCWITKQGGQC